MADHPDFIPQYKTKGAACCDMVANLPGGPVQINPGASVIIDCGFRMQLPEGWEAQIRARSGLATKGIMARPAAQVEYKKGENPYVDGLVITNWPGTIDDDYRGRMAVILTNVGRNIIQVEHKQRIAQMAIKPVWWFDWEEVDELDDSERGDGAFGSTGTK